MIKKDDCIPVGFIQKTHGIKGNLQIKFYDTIDQEDFNPEFLLVDVEGGLVPFFIDSENTKMNARKSDIRIIKFEDIDNEKIAKELLQCQVFLPGTWFEEESNTLFDDFIGYLVIDKKNGEIGTITDVLPYPQNPVFQILKDSKEILIPATTGIIIDISHTNKTVLIDAPEGLFEIYESE